MGFEHKKYSSGSPSIEGSAVFSEMHQILFDRTRSRINADRPIDDPLHFAVRRGSIFNRTFLSCIYTPERFDTDPSAAVLEHPLLAFTEDESDRLMEHRDRFTLHSPDNTSLQIDYYNAPLAKGRIRYTPDQRYIIEIFLKQRGFVNSEWFLERDPNTREVDSQNEYPTQDSVVEQAFKKAQDALSSKDFKEAFLQALVDYEVERLQVDHIKGRIDNQRMKKLIQATIERRRSNARGPFDL